MSSSRLCQTGQTIKSKGWQEEKPFCPSSPRPPTCRTRRTSSPPELPHPASRRRPTFCRAKEKVKPGARSADLRATNITFPPLPGARAPQNKTPSRAVRLPAHATARPGCPPSSLPPSLSRPAAAQRGGRPGPQPAQSGSPHPPGQPVAPLGEGNRGELRGAERGHLRCRLPPSFPAKTSGARQAALPPAASAQPLLSPAAPSCGAEGRRRRGPGSPGAVGGSRHRKRVFRGGGCPT